MKKESEWDFFKAFSLRSIPDHLHPITENKHDSNEFHEYLMNANAGNLACQLEVAHRYKFGIGVKQSSRKSIHYYLLASEQGSKDAMLQLGNAYLVGDGVKKSEPQAFSCFKVAAELGSTEALIPLSECYLSGIGVEKNNLISVQILSGLANEGSDVACEKLIDMYLIGHGVKRSLEKARYYERLWTYLKKMQASKGDLDAVVELGDYYMRGGVYTKKSVDKGFDLYQIASIKGSLRAKMRLAQCLAIGKGVTQSIKKAAEFFEELLPYDMTYRYIYADFLLNNNIRVDYAFELLQKLVRCLPNSDHFKHLTLTSLAKCWEFGIGTSASTEIALKFYKMSADLKGGGSLCRIGAAYLNGELGLPVDKNQALKYFLESIKAGYTLGWYYLGTYYLNENYIRRARKCFEIAKANGLEIDEFLSHTQEQQIASTG